MANCVFTISEQISLLRCPLFYSLSKKVLGNIR